MWAQTSPEGNLAQFGNIQLHGGDVGGLAAALAALRYKQIKDAQDAVVAAGEGISKEMDKRQAEQAIAASIQTGQNADLIPQGSYGTGPTAGIMAMDLAKQLEVQRLRDMQQMLDKNHQGVYDAEAAYKNAMAGAIKSGQRFNSATQGKTQYTLPDGTVVWLTGNELARMMGANPADQSRAQKQKLDTASGTVSGLLGYDDMDSVRAALSGGATGIPYQAGKTPFPLGQGNDTPGPIKDQIIKAVGDYNAARTGQSPVAQGYGVPPPQAPPAFPPAGTKGTIKGQPVVSDGTGWLPDTP